MPTVQFYTRAGCHLCDDALTVVERVRRERTFALEIIDVDSDPALARAFGGEVPVVIVDGRKHAKYFVDESALRRRLDAGGDAAPTREEA